MGSAKIHQHTVVAGNRNNLHRGDDGGRKLRGHDEILLLLIGDSGAAEHGTLAVKFPAGDQILHRHRVITRASRQRLIGLMGFLHLRPVQLDTKAWRIRYGNLAVLNLQRIFGQTTVAFLPDPVSINCRRVACAAAPT